MKKMSPKMWNVFQECGLVAKPYVVEQNKVLMDLSHIANMRDYRNIKDPGQKADGQELAYSRDARAVDLDKRECPRLQEILEQDTIRNMLAGSDLDRMDGPRKLGMSLDVIRMGRLFDPVRVELCQLPAYA